MIPSEAAGMMVDQIQCKRKAQRLVEGLFIDLAATSRRGAPLT